MSSPWRQHSFLSLLFPNIRKLSLNRKLIAEIRANNLKVYRSTSEGERLSSAANNKYHESAEQALAELDSQKADKLFLELVLAIEEGVNKNQKDVATELQRIARAIESEGNVDESVRFKQRTCEVMLRRSMAERRRNLPPPVPTRDGKTLTQMIFISFVSDPATYAQFLVRTGLNQELRVLPDGSRWVRSKDAQLMLLCRQGRLSGFFPLFVAISREDGARSMQDSGHHLDGDEIDVCGMKLLVIKDKSGQRFLLAGSEILQNM